MRRDIRVITASSSVRLGGVRYEWERALEFENRYQEVGSEANVEDRKGRGYVLG
jgi:hypothetical protein